MYVQRCLLAVDEVVHTELSVAPTLRVASLQTAATPGTGVLGDSV
jgi:hypothetical protein